MPVTIRLMRMGKKNQPTYRIVAIDKRKKRNSKYIEQIGSYNPFSSTSSVVIHEERLKSWINKGAQVSEGIQKLLGKKIRRD